MTERNHVCIGLEGEHSWSRTWRRVPDLQMLGWEWIKWKRSGTQEDQLDFLYDSPGGRRSGLRSLVARGDEKVFGRELRRKNASMDLEVTQMWTHSEVGWRATHEWWGVAAMGVRNWVLCGIIGRSLLVQWKRPNLKIRHRKVWKSRENWGWRNEFRTHIYICIHTGTHTCMSMHGCVMYTFSRPWD